MRVFARRGMVASPHYLATGTGVSVLRRGGSAVDAAIAVNAVLAVVTPYVCGLGGDLFAMIYAAKDARLTGLNASGRAPGEATPDRVAEYAGASTMPQRGPLTITAPGCVDGWATLHARYGRLPWSELFADAVTYARDGFPVSGEFARAIGVQAEILDPRTPARATFLPGGEAPNEGQVVAQPRLARTLETIATEGRDAFYVGEIGREIARAVRDTGGLLSTDDLAAHTSDWVEPLSITYRDATVYELPPNSQGIIALLMLGILNAVDGELLRESEERWIHLLAEAARLAYRDRAAHLTDLSHMAIDPVALISSTYLAQRAALMGERASNNAPSGTPGDTVYLCTADEDGNLVSLIESNFMGIGSGVMGGETGVMLQNRGAWFSLSPTHHNVIAPGKRTLHTLMPGMAFRGDQPWLVFGTMGGSMQAQIHVQLLSRMIDWSMALDLALDAPRFDAVPVLGGNEPQLRMEDRFPAEVLADLRARGHAIEMVPSYSSSMGHAHAIQVLEGRGYLGASDPRTQSLALGY